MKLGKFIPLQMISSAFSLIPWSACMDLIFRVLLAKFHLWGRSFFLFSLSFGSLSLLVNFKQVLLSKTSLSPPCLHTKIPSCSLLFLFSKLPETVLSHMNLDSFSGRAGQAHHSLPLWQIATKTSRQSTKSNYLRTLETKPKQAGVGERSWNLKWPASELISQVFFTLAFPWGWPQVQNWKGVSVTGA